LALNPALSIGQFLHTAWTEADGAALPEVRALAEDSGGYLWLGTAQGLFRFDGLRFTRWMAPGINLPEDIYIVVPARSGGLWFGSHTSVCRVRDAQTRCYEDAGRQLGGGLIGAADAGPGGLWLLASRYDSRGPVTTAGLLALDGSMRVFGPPDGLPDGLIAAIAPGAAEKGLRLLRAVDGCDWLPGAPAVCHAYPFPGILPPGGALHGQLSMRMLLDPDRDGPAAASSRLQGVAAALRDRKGTLWAATAEGLLRVQKNGLDRFSRQDGLSGNFARSLLEDREGDLWVATNNGIDRFRDPIALHLSTADGLASDNTSALAASPDGSVWAGAGDGNLQRIRNGRIERLTWAPGLNNNVAWSLYADPAGRLWIGSSRGLFHEAGGRFEEIPTADGTSLHRVGSISGDSTGRIRVMDQNLGLLEVRGASAERVDPPRIVMPFRVLAASDGTTWAGSYKNGVVLLGAGTDAAKSSPVVLHDGPTHFIYEDRARQVWVGTGSSLSRWRNRRWTTWGTSEGLPDAFLYGMVEDDAGGFWVLTPAALLRLDRAELDRTADGAPRPLRVASYGAADGLHLMSWAVPSPRIVKAADGRVWICESTGLAVVDPATLRRNAIPPPVHIEQLQWNGKPADTAAGLASFKAGEVHIAYTGISLSAPDRVRFRYRLEPKGEWIDAAARRDVTYAGLAPGRYRFHVAAANRDGIWNEEGAAIEFRVEPYFYQTVWFALACGAAVGLTFLALHRLRIRRLRQHFELVAQERARVTREIHDSLLQGFTGVVYQLDAAARQFESDPTESRRTLEGALDRADEAMREAREMLSTMRLPALEDHTLPEALAETGARLTRDTGAAFQSKVRGSVEPLRYEVQANLFLIGREAIANAAMHAGASRIDIRLDYTDKEFLMAVQDNGKGFDAGQAEDRNGHWGLRNMRERARSVGAGFSLETAPGKGTRIEVRVRRR
jgi:signal transduction histidine kinase/streptogramin lyase